MRKWLVALLLFWSGLAAAQEPSPELRARIGELAALLLLEVCFLHGICPVVSRSRIAQL